MNQTKTWKLGSLFDGIGGFPYAGLFFGIEPVWGSDILPAAISVTKRHLPIMEHVGDITKLDGAKLAPADIITFGSPCQGLSLAGKRGGLADPRSGLFMEAIRIIREMREATNGKYPTFALWENVPGAMSTAGGADFKAVLEAFTETEVPVPRSGKWANAGMVRSDRIDLAWCVYDAQHFGVAQRRRRVFLIVDFAGKRAGEILFVPKSLRGYFAAGPAPRQGSAAYAVRSADGAGRDAVNTAFSLDSDGSNSMKSGNPHSGCRAVETARTIDTTNPCPSKNQGGIAIVEMAIPINMQTITRHESLGDGTGFGLGKDGDNAYTIQASHSHAVFAGREITSFACNQRDEVRDLHDVSAALCAQPGMKAQTFIADSPNCLTPWDTQQSRVYTADGVSATLAGADGGGGRNPAGLVFTPEEANVAAFLGGAGSAARSIGYSEKVSPTLKAGACGFIAPCLCAATGQPNAEIIENLSPTLNCQHEQPIVCEPELARTLTADHGSPCADRGENIVAVHQGQDGSINTAPTSYTLTTAYTASARNAPLVAHPTANAFGITAKGNGECFINDECHYTLTSGGGMPGQGYPAVLLAHPDVTGTLCASGAGLSRPAGLASETDLCVVVPDSEPIPIHDRATRCNGGGSSRNGDGCGNGLGVGKSGDPAPTITSGDRHAVASYCLQGNMIGREDCNGPGGNGVNKDISFTINTIDRHAVAFNRQSNDVFSDGNIAGTQTARQGKNATDLICEEHTGAATVDCRNYNETAELSGTLQAKDSGGYSLNSQNPVRAGYTVRRLTPTECERLQGYPDGWTEFGHDGKPISDSARYMLLGNSVAVPCVAYILMGIAEQLNMEGGKEKADHNQ